MNRNIDLTKILKNCPEGTEFWSDIFGKVQFLQVNECFDRPILVRRADGFIIPYTKEGWDNIIFPESCLLWPSKDCRDWSKFILPKKDKFNPKTLKPFDKVLVRDSDGTALLVEQDETRWKCALYSHERGNESIPYKYATTDSPYVYCIPYNDNTKHLVGTKEEAPEYYKYWED